MFYERDDPVVLNCFYGLTEYKCLEPSNVSLTVPVFPFMAFLKLSRFVNGDCCIVCLEREDALLVSESATLIPVLPNNTCNCPWPNQGIVAFCVPSKFSPAAQITNSDLLLLSLLVFKNMGMAITAWLRPE